MKIEDMTRDDVRKIVSETLQFGADGTLTDGIIKEINSDNTTTADIWKVVGKIMVEALFAYTRKVRPILSRNEQYCGVCEHKLRDLDIFCSYCGIEVDN